MVKKILLAAWAAFLLFGCQNTTTKNNDHHLKNETDAQISQKKPNKEALKIAEAPAKISPVEQKMIAANLVNIQSIDSTLRVELKYSTTDNFMRADVYGDFTKAFLQKTAAIKLAKANEILKKQHPTYCLLIYDAARPRSIQQVLWDTLKMPYQEKRKYVTDPKEGSIHNYGCAVDLTIFDNSTQMPLDMGTKFDFFGKLAYTTHENDLLRKGQLTQKQFNNRRLLRQIMLQAGYQETETEWWHFVAFSRADTERMYKIVE